MNSTQLIAKIRERHKELQAKGFEWRDFYNAYLEGYTESIRELAEALVLIDDFLSCFDKDSFIVTEERLEAWREERKKFG